MIVAASRMVIAPLRTAGSVVIKSLILTSLASLPPVTAWATSVSVMMPAGQFACSSMTTRAVVPACFIR